MSGDLLERCRANRLAVQISAQRLSVTRTVVRSKRVQQQRLIEEIRQQLTELRRSLAIAWAPALLVGARRPAPDAVDALRQSLHETYAATRDPAVRVHLMDAYDGFARSLALKFRHRESVDDLVQVARIGLLHAIDRFDPGLGRPFLLFARVTITGELKRHIRDKSWAMRIPRSLQEDYLNVMRAVDELTTVHSDSPSMEALAERCGMSVERVVEAMELRVSQRALSIDIPTGMGSDEPAIELSQEDFGFRQLENRELLTQLLGRLPERDRRIIELRFIHDMTQSDIAAEIGVSQMCVSRVLARTLGRLRLWARSALN